MPTQQCVCVRACVSVTIALSVTQTNRKRQTAKKTIHAPNRSDSEQKTSSTQHFWRPLSACVRSNRRRMTHSKGVLCSISRRNDVTAARIPMKKKKLVQDAAFRFSSNALPFFRAPVYLGRSCSRCADRHSAESGSRLPTQPLHRARDCISAAPTVCVVRWNATRVSAMGVSGIYQASMHISDRLNEHTPAANWVTVEMIKYRVTSQVHL